MRKIYGKSMILVSMMLLSSWFLSSCVFGNRAGSVTADVTEADTTEAYAATTSMEAPRLEADVDEAAQAVRPSPADQSSHDAQAKEHVDEKNKHVERRLL